MRDLEEVRSPICALTWRRREGQYSGRWVEIAVETKMVPGQRLSSDQGNPELYMPAEAVEGLRKSEKRILCEKSRVKPGMSWAISIWAPWRWTTCPLGLGPLGVADMIECLSYPRLPP